MKLTIIQAGAVPEPLRGDFPQYSSMFIQMLVSDGAPFDIEVINVAEGASLPDPQTRDGLLITGSPSGVYDSDPWIGHLRDFIVAAYGARTKMVGICFGHQIIADALGGEVRKSEKGWGLGRHTYDVVNNAPHFDLPHQRLSVACSHQDQVIVPPANAKVILRSEFTPNAGLAYDNGAVLTVQPHPEFDDDYAAALIDLRRGRAPEPVIEAASASMATPSDSAILARTLTRFLSV